MSLNKMCAAHVSITLQGLMPRNLKPQCRFDFPSGKGHFKDHMVTLKIGRIIIELPLPGKCRSILNSASLSHDLKFQETSKTKLAHQEKISHQGKNMGQIATNRHNR